MIDRPVERNDYGLPMACPTEGCGYRWLKLPGLKMRPCPNCGATLVRMRPRHHKQAS